MISKNEILVKWQKCVMEIMDRDKKLQVMKKALENQREFNITLQTELRGVFNEKRKEIEINGSLRHTMRLKENEEAILQDDIKKVLHE